MTSTAYGFGAHKALKVHFGTKYNILITSGWEEQRHVSERTEELGEEVWWVGRGEGA